MSVINGTFNQTVKANRKFGGAVVVFEGKPELLIGGFSFNIDDLPAPGDVLPCGTPVYCDEETRTIVPVIVGTIEAVDTSAKTITIADHGFGQAAFKVGDSVGLLGSFDTVATSYATVTSKENNILTLTGNITSASVGAVIVALDDSHKPKATPNALLPYDVVRDADAVSVDGDGAWKNDRPVLTRRMPAFNNIIKTALENAGCQFKFSNRK